MQQWEDLEKTISAEPTKNGQQYQSKSGGKDEKRILKSVLARLVSWPGLYAGQGCILAMSSFATAVRLCFRRVRKEIPLLAERI